MYVSKYNLIFNLDRHVEKVLLNPLSESIDIIDTDDDKILDFLSGKSQYNCLSEKEIEYLSSRGYLFNSEESELDLVSKALINDEQESALNDFLIYPTFQCNFNCIYCYQKDKLLSKKMMTQQCVDNAFNAIDHIISGSKAKPLLYIFGGEPLLKNEYQKNIIRYILSESHNRRFRIGVISNGSNLSYYSEILKTYGVEFVQITLDGPRQIHDARRMYANGRGSFNDIISGIEQIKDHLNIMIRINLDSHNIDSLPEIADLCVDYGWFKENITVFVGPYRDLLYGSYQYQIPEYLLLEKIFSFYEEFPQTKSIGLIGWPGLDYLFHFMKNRTLLPPRVRYCIANYGRFGFDPDGNIYACGNAAGRKDLAVGRFYPKFYLDRNLLTIWRKRRFIDFRCCNVCKFAFLCGGGCTLQSLLKYDGKMPYCPSIFENMRVVMDHCFDQLIGENNVLQQI